MGNPGFVGNSIFHISTFQNMMKEMSFYNTAGSSENFRPITLCMLRMQARPTGPMSVYFDGLVGNTQICGKS